MAPSRLWLIRHAESVWNAAGRWQGQADPPLSALGQQQAELLHARLRAFAPAAIYTSDLRRCVETAALAARATGLVAETRRALREIDVGSWSGLTRREIEQAYPEEWACVLAGEDVRRGGGETTADLAARVRAFAAQLAAGHDGEGVAVFTHGGWIRAALDHYLGRGTAGPTGRFIGIGNTSVTELAASPSGYRLVALADRSHLDGLAAAPEPPPTPLRPAPASGYTPDV